MLTPTTVIHTPGLIDPNREPWTGTIAEHFDLAGDRAWDKLSAILADNAPTDETWTSARPSKRSPPPDSTTRRSPAA